jgi:hypothetical protein
LDTSAASTQTFSIHLPAPLTQYGGVDYFGQVYFRIESRSGNPFQAWNSCGIIFDPGINAFFMEGAGIPGEHVPAWLTNNGGPIYGGQQLTFSNSQCVFHGKTSWASTNPSTKEVNANVTISFKTPGFISQTCWTYPAPIRSSATPPSRTALGRPSTGIRPPCAGCG